MISYESYKPVYLSGAVSTWNARENRNDYRVRKWCRQYTLISPEEQAIWAQRITKDPTVKMFSINCDSTHDIGVCGFTSIDRVNRNAEFSLYINPENQGNGYGEKALKTLLRHGFEDWGFKRIWGEVFEGNPAMKIFERVGFNQEGTLRASYFREGIFIDSYMIGILAEEFRK